MKFTNKQWQVINRLRYQHMIEEVIPLSPYRGLGARVNAERRYFFVDNMTGKKERVPYATFHRLFKTNMIEPISREITYSMIIRLTSYGQTVVSEAIKRKQLPPAKSLRRTCKK